MKNYPKNAEKGSVETSMLPHESKQQEQNPNNAKSSLRRSGRIQPYRPAQAYSKGCAAETEGFPSMETPSRNPYHQHQNPAQSSSEKSEEPPIVTQKNSYRTRKKLLSVLQPWYGEEDAQAEMMKYLPKTRPIGEILQKVLRRKISANTLNLQKIQMEWEKIAGESTARRSFPLKIYARTLYLEVSHPAYIQALESPRIKDAILKRIQAIIGPDSCTDIKYLPAGRRMQENRR